MEYTFQSLSPSEVSVGKFHQLLLGTVTPRPIGFISSIDAEGNHNLAPFSFFNVFGANPPLMIFSPARRVRDNSIKHSLENAYATKEVVINLVDFPMVQQMSLSSCEYEAGVSEFIKSGLTPTASEIVKPPRVLEAPASFECEVINIIETGTEGGAGNLVICKVVKAHIAQRWLNEAGEIDHLKSDMVARLGGDWYARITKENMFLVPKPNLKKGIGFDNLPEWLFNLPELGKNELARIANLEILPEGKLPFDLQEDIIVNRVTVFDLIQNRFENLDDQNAAELLFWAYNKNLMT
jgi:flavin reductase (DIM6/NTAB) family NADH-FMN oxidoreductase RutF